MRRFRIHRFGSMMLAGLLLLAGCSGNAGPSPADSGQTGQSGQTGSSAGGSTGGGEQVTVSMHSWRVEDAEGYKKIIEAFEKENPNIKIDFKPFKATEYNTILNTALQSESGPDILQLRPYAPGVSLAEAGHLEPLDNLPGIQNFSKDVLAAATGKDGKVYGVPLSLNSTQIYYNKKLFEQHGLSEPKSWDDLIGTAKTLKEKGIIPFAFGAKEGWLLSLSHGVIAPGTYNGNAFVNKILQGQADFTSPEFVQSIQRMQELVPYFPENFAGLDLNDTRTLFFTEKAAMFINGSFELEGLQKMNPDLAIDFFPMPTEDGNTVLTTWVDGSYAVNSKAKHKAEALKFLEFMATKQFGELFANEFKRISAVPGVQTSDPLVNKMAELSQSNATPYLMVVHFAEGNPTTKQTLENALQGMYLNKLTPEQVVDEVQKSAASWFPPFKK
ncbi:extracellular solute-binding protein [Brevibacillus composti]|uniref:Extracellular solute-binding protein n=1 Tax=Brevibacillus composti TaxID=2796470 RepID=A0A7T5EJ57_9BACL|nr:extracellular solute-binding protein [Brevibacillus composti]QQE73569.1 extracellular solute-binding protein [Brevibacillus composti]QUO40651.1 extracellular solute-binding protein [Brevibacillus composti]